MKHHLIDKTTGIETLCDKVTIEGFDYYVSPSNKDFKINEASIYKKWKLGVVTNVNDDILEFEGEFIDESDLYKIVWSNNPNIYIPKMVNELVLAAEEYTKNNYPDYLDKKEFGLVVEDFIAGTKYQAKRSYSEEEVIVLLQKYRLDLSSGKTPNLGDTTKHWFEQFRKK
jgi:hypothetical protein